MCTALSHQVPVLWYTCAYSVPPTNINGNSHHCTTSKLKFDLGGYLLPLHAKFVSIGDRAQRINAMEASESEQALPNVAIVREIYDGENAHETFELELERALEAGCSTIVIEPSKLGDETARWIAVGNCLHKTAVLCGFGSVMTGAIWPDRLYIYFPLGAVSLFCTGLYTVSWQFDPCCKYQVEHNVKKLSRLPLHTLASSSPVVLVRRDDSRRKALHCSVTLAAVGYCGWRLYQSLL